MLLYTPQQEVRYWNHIAYKAITPCEHPPTVTYWNITRLLEESTIKLFKHLSPSLPLQTFALPTPLPHWGGPTSCNSFQQTFKVVIGPSQSWVSFGPNAVCSLFLFVSPSFFLSCPFSRKMKMWRESCCSQQSRSLLQTRMSVMKHLTATWVNFSSCERHQDKDLGSN